jgi:hypothetical protein
MSQWLVVTQFVGTVWQAVYVPNISCGENVRCDLVVYRSLSPSSLPRRLIYVVTCRYILPSLSLVPSDAEEWVRVEYASLIAELATSAHRLLMGLHHSADQPQPHDTNAPEVGHIGTLASVHG